MENVLAPLGKLKVSFASFLVSLILVTNWATAQSDFPQLRGKVSLELRFAKTTLLKGELIFAEVIAKNLLSEDLQIPSLHQLVGGLRLRGTDLNSNRLKFVGVTIEAPSETILLPAKSEAVGTVSVHTDLGNDENSRHPQKEFLLGSYKVWCVLADIESNVVTFRVVSPTGSEANVYQELLELYTHPEDQEARARRVIEHNPGSAYLPSFYLSLLGRAHTSAVRLRQSDQLKEISLEFISRFPHSLFVETALAYFRDGLEIEIGVMHHRDLTADQKRYVRDELVKLKSNLTGTRAAGYIDRMVKASLTLEQ